MKNQNKKKCNEILPYANKKYKKEFDQIFLQN